MKGELLSRILRAKAAKEATLLVTELDSGKQVLLLTDGQEGELSLTPDLREEAAALQRADKSGRIGEGAYFVQVMNPPLRLMIIGAVHISQALAPMAELSGYDVTIIDPRRAWATDARFPGIALRHDWPEEALAELAPDKRSAIVTLTHDPKIDDPALEAALGSSAFYIAALGSKRTHAKRCERLKQAGWRDSDLNRIYGPAGLNIGAKSPAEIALSVMAEMTAVLRGGGILDDSRAAKQVQA